MPYGVNGGAEDHVLDAAVAVGAHHYDVGVDFFGYVDDFFAGVAGVADDKARL